MSESSKAVFLSYASQDAEAAKRICAALRQTGMEVWFDQSELVGGDSWDAKIRKQIAECALFVPLISANTQARLEGYFRIEWKLAAQRTHAMAEEKTFLLPIVLDATRDAEAKVPAEFKTVQWTKLSAGEASEKFCARVKKILDGEVAPVSDRRFEAGETMNNAGQRPALPRKQASRPWSVLAIVGAAFLVAAAVYFALRPRRSPEEIAKLLASVQTTAADAAAKAAPASPTASPPADAAGFPRDPDLKRAWNLFLNTSNNTTEDFALAEDLVKAVAARRPTDVEVVIVYAWLNDTYINRGFDLSEERFMLGRRYAERALQLAPKDPEALAAFGQFLSFRGADLGRAEQLLRQAIALNPHEARFYRALAYNVLREGPHPAEALQLEERAAELFPQDPLVFYELGVLYREAGRPDDMEHAFDRCLTLAPIGSAMLWKAWIAAWVHGDVAGMKHWLDQLPATARLSDRALIVRYESACLTRDPTELADSVRSLQAFPGSALRDFWYTGSKALLLGDLYAAQGQPELAKGQYELALAEASRQKIATPTDWNVLTAETWALIALGRREEALAAMRVRVSLMLAEGAQHSIGWWFAAVPAYLMLGDRADALPLLKRITATPALRNQVRTALRIDPRMAAWRDDLEINALVAEPK